MLSRSNKKRKGKIPLPPSTLKGPYCGKGVCPIFLVGRQEDRRGERKGGGTRNFTPVESPFR